MSTLSSSSDADLLAASIAGLARDSKLEYRGEFGNEIATFIPFVAWLKREGYLSGRRIVTYAGMRPYYFFLDESEIEEKSEPRIWFPPPQRYWPSNSTYTAVASPWHVYPDYRAHFQQSARRFARPVLFIQNKFTVEWGEGPINYLPLNSLRRLLDLTAGKFDVVYSRPHEVGKGFSYDNQALCEYPDQSVIRTYPHVVDLEAQCRASGENYNQVKLETLAQSHLFVAAQGGGAHLLACFGDSLLLLLHNAGEEYPHTYQHGPYKYLSATPVWLLVAQNTEELKGGIEIVGNAVFRDGKLLLPPTATEVAKKLSL
jgi:hypothetical protein